MAAIKPKPGFEWSRVTWSAPEGRIPPLCSYCFAPIAEGDVPLMLWKQNGAMAQFCERCGERWFGLEISDEDGEC